VLLRLGDLSEEGLKVFGVDVIFGGHVDRGKLFLVLPNGFLLGESWAGGEGHVLNILKDNGKNLFMKSRRFLT